MAQIPPKLPPIRSFVALQRSAAFDRGGAVGAGRPAARQRRLGPHRRRRRRRRFLPRRPPAHLPPHRQADRAGQAGRRGDGRRVARVERGQGQDRRARLPRRAGAEHALGANIRRYAEIVRERAIMRQLVAVGDEIADTAFNPHGQGRRPAARRGRVARSSRSPRRARAAARASSRSSRCSRRWSSASTRSTTATTRPTSPACRPASRDLDQHDLRPAAGRPGHRRRPPEHGQDRARAQHRRARRARAAGCRWRCSAWKWAGTQLAMRMLGSVGRLDQHKLRTGAARPTTTGTG